MMAREDVWVGYARSEDGGRVKECELVGKKLVSTAAMQRQWPSPCTERHELERRRAS